MKFKFENLLIWQKAMELGESINSLSKFPNKELYNLSSQINRAVDSIALNISELEFDKNYEASFNLMNMMNAFRKNIK